MTGADDWARDPTLATADGRRAVEDDIDAHVARWCAARPAAEIVERLSAAGVPAEPVVRAHEHDRLEQVVWRKLFERVEHPVTGPADYIGAPFRFTRAPRVHHRFRSPLLGEHNREVLSRVLGFSDEAIDELERDGVIGDLVVGGVLH